MIRPRGITPVITFYLIACLSFLLATWTSPDVVAQSNQFRGSQAHFGAGLGIFTYHGRVNLTDAKSSSNFTRSSDPALVVFGSFPIIRDRLFFRGLIGVSNLQGMSRGGELTNNEFLNRELIWFEPQVVYTLTAGSRSLILPYVYTGFGTLVADPFGGTSSRIDQPGLGGAGPDRSVFAWPIGLGIDYPVSSRLSVFADASFRINFNYVGRNDEPTNPHNTSLFMVGMRMSLAKTRRVYEEVPPVELPDPLPVPPYSPPTPLPEHPSDQCTLLEMNTLFFVSDSTSVTPIMRELLDENVEALELSPACCAMVEGYTDGASTEEGALNISRERAELVYSYYVDEGIVGDRLAIREYGTALPCLKKEDPECAMHKRVESVMVSCNTFPGYRN